MQQNHHINNRGGHLVLRGHQCGAVRVAEAAIHMRTFARMGSRVVPDFSVLSMEAISHPEGHEMSVRRAPTLQLLRIFLLPAGHRRFEIIDSAGRVLDVLPTPPPLAEDIEAEDQEIFREIGQRYGFTWEAPIVTTQCYRDRTVEEYRDFTATSEAQFRELARQTSLRLLEEREAIRHEKWVKAKADAESADAAARAAGIRFLEAQRAREQAAAAVAAARQIHLAKVSSKTRRREAQTRRVPSARPTVQGSLAKLSATEQAAVPDWYLQLLTGSGRSAAPTVIPAPSMQELAPTPLPAPVKPAPKKQAFHSFDELAAAVVSTE